jgi:hypothetical protein
MLSAVLALLQVWGLLRRQPGQVPRKGSSRWWPTRGGTFQALRV